MHSHTGTALCVLVIQSYAKYIKSWTPMTTREDKHKGASTTVTSVHSSHKCCLTTERKQAWILRPRDDLRLRSLITCTGRQFVDLTGEDEGIWLAPDLLPHLRDNVGLNTRWPQCHTSYWRLVHTHGREQVYTDRKLNAKQKTLIVTRKCGSWPVDIDHDQKILVRIRVMFWSWPENTDQVHGHWLTWQEEIDKKKLIVTRRH